jgi:hypothetical protein
MNSYRLFDDERKQTIKGREEEDARKKREHTTNKRERERERERERFGRRLFFRTFWFVALLLVLLPAARHDDDRTILLMRSFKIIIGDFLVKILSGF